MRQEDIPTALIADEEGRANAARIHVIPQHAQLKVMGFNPRRPFPYDIAMSW